VVPTKSNTTDVEDLERLLDDYEKRTKFLETELVELKQLLDEHVRVCPAASLDES
jgi:hypothetical protein